MKGEQVVEAWWARGRWLHEKWTVRCSCRRWAQIARKVIIGDEWHLGGWKDLGRVIKGGVPSCLIWTMEYGDHRSADENDVEIEEGHVRCGVGPGQSIQSRRSGLHRRVSHTSVDVVEEKSLGRDVARGQQLRPGESGWV